MHAPLLITAALLFASMFVPLPSPVGLAVSLWAVGEGVPLPAVLGLYVLQDVVSYTAVHRVVPRLTIHLAAWSGRLPVRLRRPVALLLRPAVGGGGLFSAALISFYAAAAIAALREHASLRSAAIVIATDVVKYVNGLAVALGAAFVLPHGPISTVAASLLGLTAALVMQAIGRRRTAAPATLTASNAQLVSPRS